MTRTELLGNMPLHQCGPNKGRLDRKKASIITGLSAKELSKAYNNWIQIFRIPESSLTFEQYLKKLEEVGIKPTDVGNSINCYQLSRVNDNGPYKDESCRFILKRENLDEQEANGKRAIIFESTVAKHGYEKTIEIMRKNGSLGRKAKTNLDR